MRGIGPVLLGTALTGVVAWAGFGSRSQTFGPFPFRGDTADQVVALSFDDGPNEPHTSQLLDTLDRQDVRATFFQVGLCAERFPAVTRRVVESGHVLGNHSYRHAMTGYLSDPRQRAEIDRAQHVLHRIVGVAPALYRPPWLCHWPWVLRSVAAHGLQAVSGTFVHPLEIVQPPPAAIAARGGQRANSVAAVGPLIDRLRDAGYRFTTVDRLLGVPAYL